MKRKIKHEVVWDYRRIKLYGTFAWIFYAYLITKIVLFILSLNL
tara:strand:- start:6778 stop:6909 length:132 start_codon:yes stop_codon:yes gene_type:complete